MLSKTTIRRTWSQVRAGSETFPCAMGLLFSCNPADLFWSRECSLNALGVLGFLKWPISPRQNVCLVSTNITSWDASTFQLRSGSKHLREQFRFNQSVRLRSLQAATTVLRDGGGGDLELTYTPKKKRRAVANATALPGSASNSNK